MIFENIPLITKLFTGTEQQFAGVFDPAVYPVVYIMVSLQLMLLQTGFSQEHAHPSAFFCQCAIPPCIRSVGKERHTALADAQTICLWFVPCPEKIQLKQIEIILSLHGFR